MIMSGIDAGIFCPMQAKLQRKMAGQEAAGVSDHAKHHQETRIQTTGNHMPTTAESKVNGGGSAVTQHGKKRSRKRKKLIANTGRKEQRFKKGRRAVDTGPPSLRTQEGMMRRMNGIYEGSRERWPDIDGSGRAQ